MKHRGTICIKTDRLILRKFILNDISDSFRNWTSDTKVTEYLRWTTHGNVSITEQVLNDWIAKYDKPDFYQWAIVLKKINEPIGTIAVVDMDEKTKKIHIGYCIGSKWWHSGFTSEAFSAIIPFFFEQVGVNRI